MSVCFPVKLGVNKNGEIVKGIVLLTRRICPLHHLASVSEAVNDILSVISIDTGEPLKASNLL